LKFTIIITVAAKYHKPTNGPRSINPESAGGVGKEMALEIMSNNEITIPAVENIFPNLGCLNMLIAKRNVPKNM
jgi:hypothetical protein